MKARIVPVSLDDAGLARLAEGAKLLAEGGLVAFPTETVYGIGCNAERPDAVERLRQVKRRPSDKEFSIHIARVDDVPCYVGHIPPMAQKLMKRYWPGPLTLVFPGNHGKGVGLRMPSNRFALELIRGAGVPVFAPSANRAGEPPAKSAQEVAQTLGDELDLILDGGTTTLKEASTVLRVTDQGWEILRQGSITEDMIRRTLGKTLVFVCTANSCRSPMAEALCKKLLADRLGCYADELPPRGYVILSAGTSAAWDVPASYQAVEAMERFGLDIANHASRPLTPGLIEDADSIFVMARHHADSICDVLPEARRKIRLLDPSGRDIPDPVGASVEVFADCAESMLGFLREIVDTREEVARREESNAMPDTAARPLRIAVGSDHAGFQAKQQAIETLRQVGCEVQDLGTDGEASTDYPDYARDVAERVARKEADYGVLCCGTGIGMSIAANKVAGIRAAVCHNDFTCEMARRHNDANVLCLGGRVLGEREIDALVRLFLRHPLRRRPAPPTRA